MVDARSAERANVTPLRVRLIFPVTEFFSTTSFLAQVPATAGVLGGIVHPWASNASTLLTRPTERSEAPGLHLMMYRVASG